MPYDFGTISIDSRESAQIVLDVLRKRMDLYGYATLDDFYSLVNLPTDYTDSRWGWIELPTSILIREVYGGGFVIDLPKPELISTLLRE